MLVTDLSYILHTLEMADGGELTAEHLELKLIQSRQEIYRTSSIIGVYWYYQTGFFSCVVLPTLLFIFIYFFIVQ